MQRATRLREAPDAAPPGATVIDAAYKEVGPKRGGFLHNIWKALIALFWAAVIGFLIPPMWIAFESVRDMLAN